MNKTAIKNFAVWARNKLISEVKYKAGLLGITDKGIAEPLPQSTDDLQFFDIGTKQPAQLKGKTAIEQRRSLVAAIKAKSLKYCDAYEAVMEEVAYTWFNRLIAIRFMEVNDYLPSRVRVLSSENPAKAEPDFVTKPFDTDLEFTDAELDLIDDFKDRSKSEELFQFLFIKQCNKLNEILPELFEKTNDYTELLLNVSFTDKDGVVWHLVHDIPEGDFYIREDGQIEIIGWMYQFYNTELKEKAFARPSGTKIDKDDIPAVTQLFTPHWIVRYMVENSLGRLYINGTGDKNEKKTAEEMEWIYYLPEAEQRDDVAEQFHSNDSEIDITNSKFLEPCMGSGHILIYAFDVYMKIYRSLGYTDRDAAKLIVENNLYGLDIDDRAGQLAYFAVMMKGRSYDRRFLTRGIEPNLCSIQESNDIKDDYLVLFGDLIGLAKKLCTEFIDAKEYGSHLNLSITAAEIAQLEKRYNEILETSYDNMFDLICQAGLRTLFGTLVKQAKIMVQKYEVVCTNPPYMGSSGMDAKLSNFVKKNYPDSKADLFSVFMEKCTDYTVPCGYTAMITMHSWMFLSSFEKLRKKMLFQTTVNMAHLGARAFDQISGEVVQTTAFVNRKQHINGYVARYKRLIEGDSEEAKRTAFLSADYDYTANSDNFSKIPGSPVAYWCSTSVYDSYDDNSLLGDFSEVKIGMGTGKNEIFVRNWWEINNKHIDYNVKSFEELVFSQGKFFPYNKGGDFRLWYGNLQEVLWFNEAGRALSLIHI